LSGQYVDSRVKTEEDAQQVKNLPIEFANFWRPVLMPRLVHDFTSHGAGQIPQEMKNQFVIDVCKK
jgi:hypothetical protein